MVAVEKHDGTPAGRSSRLYCRLYYCAATLAIVALGLASRRFPGMFPAALGKYPGDALWTMMVFFGLAAVRPALGAARLAACALAMSFLVEFSQLYRAPWIDALRADPAGHLVLGSAFSHHDLVAYACGALAALLAEWCITCARQRADFSGLER